MNESKKPIQKKKPKKKSNLVDFQKEKSASDFIKEIKTGELYKQLKKKN